MKEFKKIINPIINNEDVLKMKDFNHHGSTTCFDHSFDVAKCMYDVCKKLNLDYKSATRAGMLHDLFLYDWKENDKSHNWHGFRHPKFALKNACKNFKLNDKEKNMIITHMWPLTPVPPKSIEGFILTIVDKYCATKEGLVTFGYFIKSKKAISYYLIYLLLIITF